jgi:hypothetical protein
MAVCLGAFRDQPEACILHSLQGTLRHVEIARVDEKSSAELTHVIGAVIFSRSGHGL